MDKRTFDESTVKEALYTAGTNVVNSDFLFKKNIKPADADPMTCLLMNLLVAKTGAIYMAEYRKEVLKLLGIEGEEK